VPPKELIYQNAFSEVKEKRIYLPKEVQKKFFLDVKRSLGNNSWPALANRFGINYWKFKNYKKGDLTVPNSCFEEFVRVLNKEKTEEYRAQTHMFDGNWGAVKGGKRAIQVLREKYGQEYLDSRRLKGQRNSPVIGASVCKKIVIPKEINSEIAELVGVYLGDGTLTDYLIRISSDKRFDLRYMQYLAHVVQKNFGFISFIRFDKKTNSGYLEIPSKKFVDYFKETFGFSTGDKIRNKARIPDVILQNSDWTKACLRGLMDTDGSFSRRDNYLCMEFTSFNPTLLSQVQEIGYKEEFFSFHSTRHTGSNSWPRIQKYFREVGSSNLRHIIRFDQRLQNNRCLYVKETLKYFPQYENVTIPYFSG